MPHLPKLKQIKLEIEQMTKKCKKRHISKKRNVVGIGQVCGFCGLSSCVPKSKLIPPNKSKGEQYFKLHSSCPYFFSYGRRPEYSKRNKCTNYLARCKATGCQADVWKYHMKEHYKQCHPLLTLPEVFSISNEEKDTIHLLESK